MENSCQNVPYFFLEYTFSEEEEVEEDEQV
jgi:hypothetical protein